MFERIDLRPAPRPLGRTIAVVVLVAAGAPVSALAESGLPDRPAEAELSLDPTLSLATAVRSPRATRNLTARTLQDDKMIAVPTGDGETRTASAAQDNKDWKTGPELRVFQPKARVYFDTGDDDVNELDIFEDGALVPAINFVELYWPRKFWHGLGQDDWRWGPSLGLGLSSPANDSMNTMNRSSGAPVLMISAGLLFEFPLTKNELQYTSLTPEQVANKSEEEIKKLAEEQRDQFKGLAGAMLGLEVGYAQGFSTDEMLDDIDDGAIYVGLSLHIPF